jgi:Putative transposase
LAYLSRYTHRVATSNSRLIDMAGEQIRFRWRDYRHHNKSKVMTLAADEFIRRFLLHTLPDAFHRIRHYGFLANRHRADKLAVCRQLLSTTAPLSPNGPAAAIVRQYGEQFRVGPPQRRQPRRAPKTPTLV